MVLLLFQCLQARTFIFVDTTDRMDLTQCCYRSSAGIAPELL